MSPPVGESVLPTSEEMAYLGRVADKVALPAGAEAVVTEAEAEAKAGAAARAAAGVTEGARAAEAAQTDHGQAAAAEEQKEEKEDEDEEEVMARKEPLGSAESISGEKAESEEGEHSDGGLALANLIDHVCGCGRNTAE